MNKISLYDRDCRREINYFRHLFYEKRPIDEYTYMLVPFHSIWMVLTWLAESHYSTYSYSRWEKY